MNDTPGAAEARLFDSYRIPFEARSMRLEDPYVEIAIRDTGSGDPVIFIHGSGIVGHYPGPPSRPSPRPPRDRARPPGLGHSDSY